MRRTKIFFKFLGVILLLVLVGGASIYVYAQKGPKDKFIFGPLNPIKMPEVKQVTLKNGLKIFLVEDHEYPTIDLRAMVRTGSVFEPASKVGLATITGQVLRTGGTTSRTGDELDRELETMAATVEAGIGQSSGYVMASMLRDDADRVFEILADILMNPAFREDKIKLAKLQQKSLVSRRNDNIGAITNREFYKLIYGKESPYARHTEYATIEAVTREDIVSFYKKYFHPNNIIMAVWGDFDAKEMEARIKKYLGSWKREKVKIPPFPKVEYEYRYTVNYVNKPDVNQSNIMIGHIGGTMDNPDYPALSVMNSILSFDRMFKKIRTDEGLAYSVWGNYGAGFRTPGVFSCGAQTKSESTVYALQLMLKEMERITREKVTDEELAKAKDQYLNSYVFNFDSKGKIVNRMVTYAYFDYPLNFVEKLKERVEKVTAEDVLRVAKKYLHPDKVQILVVGKEKDFDKPLSTLGEVTEIDISIPPIKRTKAEK
ncbi:MAG: M16 family metallopeptidase [Candidatus Aminicenantales bacterium]